MEDEREGGRGVRLRMCGHILAHTHVQLLVFLTALIQQQFSHGNGTFRSTNQLAIPSSPLTRAQPGVAGSGAVDVRGEDATQVTAGVPQTDPAGCLNSVSTTGHAAG